MGTTVRRVSGSLARAVADSWEDETPTTEITEYMYDPRVPREFYVYPPNDGAGAVRAVYSKFPAKLVNYTDSGQDADAWGDQVIDVPEEYMEALASFVLHRCFRKEAEYAADSARAKLFFDHYIEIVGAKSDADTAWSNIGG